MSVMDKKEVVIWAEILKRCGLDKEPALLSTGDQDLQWFLLCVISNDPNHLPEGETDWERWFNWHGDSGREEPVGLGW